MSSTQDDNSSENLTKEEFDENDNYEIGCTPFIRVIKTVSLLFFYVFLTGVTLISATISKGLIHFMINQISTNDRVIPFCNDDRIIRDSSKKYIVDWTRDDVGIINSDTLVQIQGTDQAHILETEQMVWVWCLIFCFCIPEIITLLKSLKEVFLNKFEIRRGRVPFTQQLLTVLFLEISHTIGVALLIFKALPQMDSVQAVAITSCIGILPFILRCGNKYIIQRKKINIWESVADFFAIALQLTGIFVWPFVVHGSRSWSLTLGLILTSFGWWESFVTPNQRNFHLVRYLCRVKECMINGTRYWIYMMIAPLKILSFIAFTWFLIVDANLVLSSWNFFTKFQESFGVHFYKVREKIESPIGSDITTDWSYVSLLKTSDSFPVWILVLQSTSSAIAYIFSLFACKVKMQQFSFAFPLSLTTPLLINVLFTICGSKIKDPCILKDFIPRYLSFQCPALTDSVSYLIENQLWMWFLWFLSQLWITRHIWSSKNVRLASMDQIFSKPFYLGLLLDQSLMLNKRRDGRVISNKDYVMTIYGCVTLWHENVEEMTKLTTSIFRMDRENGLRKFSRKHKKTVDDDYYDWETHIVFDDAFYYGEDKDKKDKEKKEQNIIDEKGQINDYVQSLINIFAKRKDVKPPLKQATPYGGQIIWLLPGETRVVCHLKDKFKMKDKKRWSQIMYMNYLIYYKTQKERSLSNKLQNTFLLALDGDVDFRPEAVSMLVDLMKKDLKTGAVCGRIHPLGKGFMKWYQTFEYAIGHWLQKSTENVMGCVLCSPGCFSLFRAEALAGEIMKIYATISERAQDFVQYDQGEDRWLCTLLLQKGWNVSYAAASNAYTFVPDNFDDFFKQRRRWMPSTMANIMDLLFSYKKVIKVNKNISYLYIIYQLMLLVGTILGPGTIFLMLVGAFSAAFKLSNTDSFLINVIPIGIYMIVCFYFNSDNNSQLFVAQILSSFYTLIMMAVLVGIMLQISEDGWLAPTTLSLFLVGGSFILAAIVHPDEIYCLPNGLIYYVTIPAMYLLLVIYSISNLNVISWGTRESSSAKSKKDEKGSFLYVALKRLGLWKEMPENHEVSESTEIASPLPLSKKRSNMSDSDDEFEYDVPVERGFLRNPYWMDHEALKDAYIEKIDQNELKFWNDLIPKYLKPTISKDTLIEKRQNPEDISTSDKDEKMKKELESLRNQVVFSFFIINSMFVVVVFLLQQQKDLIFINWPLDAKANISFIRYQNSVAIDISYEYLKLEPIGLVFIVFFATVLIVQIIGMLSHRLSTFAHIVAMNQVKKTNREEKNFQKMLKKLVEYTGDATNPETNNGMSHIQQMEMKLNDAKFQNNQTFRKLSIHPNFLE